MSEFGWHFDSWGGIVRMCREEGGIRTGEEPPHVGIQAFLCRGAKPSDLGHGNSKSRSAVAVWKTATKLLGRVTACWGLIPEGICGAVSGFMVTLMGLGVEGKVLYGGRSFSTNPSPKKPRKRHEFPKCPFLIFSPCQLVYLLYTCSWAPTHNPSHVLELSTSTIPLPPTLA